MKRTQLEHPNTSEKNTYALTSTQAAALLQVHESSIKRWCNQGELEFTKTSGGHRRFDIKGLLDFAQERKQSYPFSIMGRTQNALCEALVVYWHEDSLEAFRALLKGWLLESERESYPAIFSILYTQYNIPLPVLLDDLICALMADVGELWHQGKLSVGEEHLITQIIMNGTQKLFEHIRERASQDDSSESNLGDSRPIAISAGSEGSYHELGAKCTQLLLEEAGWQTLYAGANLPTIELGMLQKEYEAQLICISFVVPQRLSDLYRCIQALEQIYDPNKHYVLIVGGSALAQLGQTDHEVEQYFQKQAKGIEVEHFSDLRTFADWIRQRKGAITH